MRRWPLCIFLITLVLSWPIAAQALTVSGQVLDQTGQGVAGAIISDEINAVASGADGGFKLATKPGRVVSFTAPAGYTAPAKWWWPSERAAEAKLSLALEARQTSAAPLVALLADPHLFDEQSDSANYPLRAEAAQVPLKTWRRVAGELKELSPALTIVAGDLCFDADMGDELHAKTQLAMAARAMSDLPAPARALPGNHDVRYSGGKVDTTLWRRALGPARQVFLLPGAAFILLDNVGLAQKVEAKHTLCGKLPDEALTWLHRILPLLPNEYELYVVSHYPPATPIAGSNPLHGGSLVRSQLNKDLALRDADQSFRMVAKLLLDRNLAAFIHGHEHAGHTTTILARQSFQVIGLPALCGGWWQGDRKWGPYKFPPAYALLRLKSAPQGPAPELKIIEVKY